MLLLFNCYSLEIYYDLCRVLLYFYAKSVHFLVFVHYQNLHQSRAHMCNILANSFFDISEINITDEDSN